MHCNSINNLKSNQMKSTKKTLQLLIVLLFANISLYPQYTGGNADGGFVNTLTNSICGNPANFYAYFGGNGDGEGVQTLINSTCATPPGGFAYMGGQGDGEDAGMGRTVLIGDHGTFPLGCWALCLWSATLTSLFLCGHGTPLVYRLKPGPSPISPSLPSPRWLVIISITLHYCTMTYDSLSPTSLP